jgi:hypothetical protein
MLAPEYCGLYLRERLGSLRVLLAASRTAWFIAADTSGDLANLL